MNNSMVGGAKRNPPLKPILALCQARSKLQPESRTKSLFISLHEREMPAPSFFSRKPPPLIKED